MLSGRCACPLTEPMARWPEERLPLAARPRRVTRMVVRVRFFCTFHGMTEANGKTATEPKPENNPYDAPLADARFSYCLVPFEPAPFLAFRLLDLLPLIGQA